MKFSGVIFLIFFFLFGGKTSAQTEESKAEIEEYKALYPEDEFALTNVVEEYYFSKSTNSEAPVVSRMEVNMEILPLKSYKRNFSFLVGFDDNSVVRGDKVTGVTYAKMGKATTVFHSSTSHKYESNGIFHDDAQVQQFSFVADPEKTFKYNLNYVKLYSDYKYMTRADFHEIYPVRNKKLVFHIPEWLDLDLIEFNFEYGNVQKEETENPKSGERIITFYWENIPGPEDFDYQPAYTFYMPHLVMVYRAYEKGGKKIPLFQSPDNLYSWYHKLTTEVVNDNTAIASFAKDLAGGLPPLEQLKAVLYWVQDEIRYIAFEAGLAGFRPSPSDEVYTRKYGDCKGMANLTKEMLKSLGFDARLAWIGTRNHIPYDYSIPSLAVDNHMICAVFLEDKIYYLDGTEKYAAFNEYAHRIQGRPIMIEDGEKYMIKTVPEEDFTANEVLRSYNATYSPEEKSLLVDGNLRINGELKRTLLYQYNYSPSDKRDELLANYLNRNNAKFDLKSLSDLSNREIPFTASYSYSSNKNVMELGEEVYINLSLSDDLSTARTDETRTSPWIFDEKMHRKSEINFTIPESYSVDYLPPSFASESDEFKVMVNYTMEGDKIIVNKEVSIFEGKISRKNLKEWHNTLVKLKNNQEDRIILKKSN